MTQTTPQLAIPVALPATRRPPRRSNPVSQPSTPLGGLSHVQLRSELTAEPWQLEPSTTWYATASLRLDRYNHLQNQDRHELHTRLAHHITAWLANQKDGVGLQLVLAAQPQRYRVHMGLRVEVTDACIDGARERVLELGRDLEQVLGGGAALAFEPDSAHSSGLSWVAAPDVVGMAAVPVSRRMVLSEDESVATLPQLQPDLWAHGAELLRLMLEQPAPVALLLSMQRVRHEGRLRAIEAQLAHLHARLRGGVEGALFNARNTPVATRQYPENLLHITRAAEALEQQSSWLAELQRGAMAMQVHVLGCDHGGSGLALAAQRALLGCDVYWAKLGEEQCSQVKAGPLAALSCPIGVPADHLQDSTAGEDRNLGRLVPVSVGAQGLCLPAPAQEGQPGIPLERSPLRFAPPAMAHADGVLLGGCRTRRAASPARLGLTDLDRHLYVVGKTGTGKTTLLTTLMLDLRAKGLPFAVLDPHGDLADDMIHRFGAQDNVVVFDPARGIGPGLNPLHNDGTPKGVERVLENITKSMFQIYPPEYMGPVFERYSRALLVPLALAGHGMESVSRMAHDKPFRRRCLGKLSNADPMQAEVLRFWAEELDSLTGNSRSELHTYVLSKYDALVRSSSLREATSPDRQQLDLGAIMDQGKVLIARLPQGELGAISAWFLGMMLVNRLQEAVFARSSQRAESRQPYTLVLDEFQNFLGGAGYGYRNDDRSLGPFLSETRKYGLRLALAHQHLAQCDARTREAVLGNVGSMVVFRVGHNDAELLARELDDSIDPAELRKLPLFRGVASLLVNGSPATPFSLETIPPDRLALPTQPQRKRGRQR
jgi:hypothetical protein